MFPFHSYCRMQISVSFYTAPLDIKTVPSNMRPFVTPSVRPLHMDVLRSDSKAESSCTPKSSWTFSESSSTVRSHPAATSPSDDNVLSEMARLRAENNTLSNNCSMWRKRAEAHGEANLNLLKFARAIRDQASQIAKDRNELESRCHMLKQQLDGEGSYSDELRPNFCLFAGQQVSLTLVQNAEIWAVKFPAARS